MVSFWKFFLFVGVGILSACQTTNERKINQIERRQNDLMKSVNERTLNRLKNVIRTDLQYERGCRERGIEIEVCDVSNSLEVKFTAFDCKTPGLSEEELMNPNGIPLDFRKQGALCDYKAELKWPDGATESLSVSDEEYEFGIIYSNELYIEHGWMKKRSWN